MTPIEPPPFRTWLPQPSDFPPGEDMVAVGVDLNPAVLLAGYRRGIFAMELDRSAVVCWWSPEPRGILPLDGLRVTRSLAKSCRRYRTTIDTAFLDVVRACADPRRPGGWITPRYLEAYAELHRLGWAHSVETRTQEGDLVGGLFGVEVGGLFAGESMFSRATDASKVALVTLVERLRGAPEPGRRLLDVQWRTDHLASLGVVAVPRARYLDLLADALPLAPAL